MPDIARKTDRWEGICTAHDPPRAMSGEIYTASEDVFSGGLAVARKGDQVIGACGHKGVIIEGSTTVFTNGIETAMVGNRVSGNTIGRIVSGNTTHKIT